MDERGGLYGVIEGLFQTDLGLLGNNEISKDLDVQSLIGMIYGAFWYRLLFEHAPLDDQFAKNLIANVAFLKNTPTNC